MSILRFLCALMTIFVCAGGIFVSPVLANSNQETASSAIVDAEETIISTYSAVLEAEQSGGNVTGLFANLTEAGEFLAVAQMSYRNEDFGNAVYFANLCRSIGDEVNGEAYELRNSVWNENIQRMWFTMIGSVFGVTLVILGSLWFWSFFKRWYSRHVLKMKPEVTKDES